MASTRHLRDEQPRKPLAATTIAIDGRDMRSAATIHARAERLNERLRVSRSHARGARHAEGGLVDSPTPARAAAGLLPESIDEWRLLHTSAPHAAHVGPTSPASPPTAPMPPATPSPTPVHAKLPEASPELPAVDPAANDETRGAVGAHEPIGASERDESGESGPRPATRPSRPRPATAGSRSGGGRRTQTGASSALDAWSTMDEGSGLAGSEPGSAAQLARSAKQRGGAPAHGGGAGGRRAAPRAAARPATPAAGAPLGPPANGAPRAHAGVPTGRAPAPQRAARVPRRRVRSAPLQRATAPAAHAGGTAPAPSWLRHVAAARATGAAVPPAAAAALGARADDHWQQRPPATADGATAAPRAEPRAALSSLCRRGAAAERRRG